MNIIINNVGDFKTLGYGKVAELLLVNLLKIDYFGKFEDHLDFE